MYESIIPAIAALAGAVTGGLTSVLTSWLSQHAQARTQWLAQDKLLRQELYREFIEAASKCNIDALQHDEADIPALVELDRKSTRLNSSHQIISYAVFC